VKREIPRARHLFKQRQIERLQADNEYILHHLATPAGRRSQNRLCLERINTRVFSHRHVEGAHGPSDVGARFGPGRALRETIVAI
jgi:hypothetical protein